MAAVNGRPAARRLVERWRATGADLPFGDADPPHGCALEGWYWRVADPASGRVVAAMCGVIDAEWSQLVVAVHPDGIVQHLRTTWPPEQAFTARGAVLSAAVGDVRLEIAVESGPPLRSALWPALGPAHFIPSFPQYWTPLRIGIVAEGHLTVDGTRQDLRGARVYAEKNWGPHFPPAGWWWGAAHAFDDPALAVAFAGGPLVARVPFAPTALVASTRAGLVRLGTPLLSPVATEAGGGRWHVVGRGPRVRVRLDGRAEGEPLLLPHPEPHDGSLDWRAHQWSDGVVDLLVERRRGGRWRTDAAATSPVSGLEVGTPRA